MVWQIRWKGFGVWCINDFARHFDQNFDNVKNVGWDRGGKGRETMSGESTFMLEPEFHLNVKAVDLLLAAIVHTLTIIGNVSW